MKGQALRCKFCGKEVAVITYGVYRKVVVDAEAVDVVADPHGEEFVRIDGSKLRAREVAIDSGEASEPAYRIHRKLCGVEL